MPCLRRFAIELCLLGASLEEKLKASYNCRPCDGLLYEGELSDIPAITHSPMLAGLVQALTDPFSVLKVSKASTVLCLSVNSTSLCYVDWLHMQGDNRVSH